MAEADGRVVAGQRIGQIFIDMEGARHGACDLRHFETMGEPRPVMIAP
jgi:hypothetical protein